MYIYTYKYIYIMKGNEAIRFSRVGTGKSWKEGSWESLEVGKKGGSTAVIF